MRLVPVEHMDEVLRVALLIPNPETFLKEPSVAVDWRQPAERRERERREESSKFPVASSVPPAGAMEEPAVTTNDDNGDKPSDPLRQPDPRPYPFPEPAIREE
jgi:hypothetical protein